MYIDSHTHFDAIIEEGKVSTAALLEQMQTHNVTAAVQIGTDIPSTLWSRDFAADKSNIYYTAGLHPEYHFDPALETDLLQTINLCCSDHKCIAIGEIGLDYHYEGYDRANQHRLFALQLDAAKVNQLPVVIHSRDAMQDTIAIIDNAGLTQVLFHCFVGTKADAKVIIDRGWYISFAGNLTFKKAVDLHEAASYIPSERILFETDAPYLAPVPVRGTQNVPANVRHTYSFAAQLRAEPLEALAQQVKTNFADFFTRTRG